MFSFLSRAVKLGELTPAETSAQTIKRGGDYGDAKHRVSKVNKQRAEQSE